MLDLPQFRSILHAISRNDVIYMEEALATYAVQATGVNAADRGAQGSFEIFPYRCLGYPFYYDKIIGTVTVP